MSVGSLREPEAVAPAGTTTKDDARDRRQGRAPVLLPDGFALTQHAGGALDITRTWRRRKHLVTSTISATLLAGVGYAWFTALSQGELPWVIVWLLTPASLFGCYMTLAMMANTTRLRVRDGVLTVRTGPVPYLADVTLNTSALEQLFSVREAGTEARGLYAVVAETKAGTVVPIARQLRTADQALWLEAELEKALGIVDRPVAGEIARDGSGEVYRQHYLGLDAAPSQRLGRAKHGGKATSGASPAVYLLPVLFCLIPLAIIFLMTSLTARVEGAFTGQERDGGAFSLTPDHCASGESQGFHGVILRSDDAPGREVRVIQDATGEKKLAVSGGGRRRLLTAQACERFNVVVDWTDTSINEVRAVDGHADVVCPGFRGNVAFKTCH